MNSLLSFSKALKGWIFYILLKLFSKEKKWNGVKLSLLNNKVTTESRVSLTGVVRMCVWRDGFLLSPFLSIVNKLFYFNSKSQLIQNR